MKVIKRFWVDSRTQWADLTSSYCFYLIHRKDRWILSAKSGYSANRSLWASRFTELRNMAWRSNVPTPNSLLCACRLQIIEHASCFILYHSFTITLYVDEMHGENDVWVGGFGPITPTPPPTHTHTQKIPWRYPWPLPSLFRTYLAVQNCNMK